MSQIYASLSEQEKKDIEENWPTTLDELQILAAKHDAREAEDAIPAEEKRNKQSERALQNISLGKIMDMASVEQKTVEYQADDSFPVA